MFLFLCQIQCQIVKCLQLKTESCFYLIIKLGKTKTRNKQKKKKQKQLLQKFWRLGHRLEIQKKKKKNDKDKRESPLAFMVPFCSVL